MLGYPNYLTPNSNPVASGLHAEVVNDESEEPHQVSSLNPAMMYALLALSGYILNFGLLIGIGMYCLRSRRRENYDDHVIDCDAGVILDLESEENLHQ